MDRKEGRESRAYLGEKENTGSESKPVEEPGGRQAAGQTLGEQAEGEKPLSEAAYYSSYF